MFSSPASGPATRHSGSAPLPESLSPSSSVGDSDGLFPFFFFLSFLQFPPSLSSEPARAQDSAMYLLPGKLPPGLLLSCLRTANLNQDFDGMGPNEIARCGHNGNQGMGMGMPTPGRRGRAGVVPRTQPGGSSRAACVPPCLLPYACYVEGCSSTCRAGAAGGGPVGPPSTASQQRGSY